MTAPVATPLAPPTWESPCFPPASRVVIANINPGFVRTEFSRSTIVASNAGMPIILSIAGPYLDTERNRVVEQFMKMDADWLVFIDSDIDYDHRDALKLCRYPVERPVVSGVYGSCSNRVVGAVHPVVYDIVQDRDDPTHLIDAIPGDVLLRRPVDRFGLTRVGAVGAGFLATHRSVFTRLLDHHKFPCPWFDEHDVNGSRCGEDIIYSIRVSALGIPLCVDTSVVAGHIKPVRLLPYN